MASTETNQQKSMLIKILTKLSEERLPAKGLLMLVQEGNMSDQTVTALMHVVSDAIKNVKDEWLRKKLSKTQIMLKNLARMEAESRLQDDKEIQQIMKELEW